MSIADAIQIAIFKKMTPAQKIELSSKLYWNAFSLKICWLKQLHPDWSQERLETETKKIFLYART